ncbi:MAG: aspartate--ammonia ligase [Clostridia bacterium]|nr:aspartate--ammonia ligase [Clostridia bacterium]
MSQTIKPVWYPKTLNIYETQTAIGKTKRIFQDKLAEVLNLKRVTAPLFVESRMGLNDNLNGVERAVTFDIPETQGMAEIVHSLAKWKRLALYQYGFSRGEGIYTDMNAIRRDETMDNLHSIYVDQWDWESIIGKEDRTVDFLKETVRKIVGAICDTLDEIKKDYPGITITLNRDVTFVTSQELEDMYPDLTSKQRENAITKEHKTVFIIGIGDVLKSGNKHDGRAPDYDDWKLNGDLLFYNPMLDSALEISSMGIRVDRESLEEQLMKADCEDRRTLPFHQMLLDGTLPLTMGGGIGQSRLCMLLLEKAHVGEVQVSVWDKNTRKAAEEYGMNLL